MSTRTFLEPLTGSYTRGAATITVAMKGSDGDRDDDSRAGNVRSGTGARDAVQRQGADRVQCRVQGRRPGVLSA